MSKWRRSRTSKFWSSSLKFHPCQPLHSLRPLVQDQSPNTHSSKPPARPQLLFEDKGKQTNDTKTTLFMPYPGNHLIERRREENRFRYSIWHSPPIKPCPKFSVSGTEGNSKFRCYLVVYGRFCSTFSSGVSRLVIKQLRDSSKLLMH